MLSTRLLLAAAAALLVAAFAGRLFALQRVEAQLAENELLLAALVPLRAETREADELRAMVVEMLLRKHVAEVIREHSPPVVQALAELSRLPREIVLDKVEIGRAKIIATGAARDGKPFRLEKGLKR